MVGLQRIHHQLTGLGKAQLSCKTVHGDLVRARVENDTFLSGIVLGLNTVHYFGLLLIVPDFFLI